MSGSGEPGASLEDVGKAGASEGAAIPSSAALSIGASPAKKSSSTSSHHKIHRGKGHRRLSQGITSISALRDTLQAFGDDVIKIKDPPPTSRNHLHLVVSPQMDLVGGSVNPSFDSSGLIDVFSGRNKADEGVSSSRGSDAIKFERIPSDEVGVRSKRWKKALVAGLVSSRLPRNIDNHKSESADEQEFHEIPSETFDRKPPFWGVGVELRSKFSLLNLQMILHEIGCFTSCILLGCLTVRAMEVVTSVSTRGSDVKASWNFSRLYGSFQSLLLLFTSLGFLIRVNTLSSSSLLTMPFLMAAVVILVSTEYLNKAWDLQRHECLSYFRLDELAKAKALLSHDCSYWKAGNHQNSSSSSISIFIAVLPVIVAFFMSLFLFLFRNSYYLIDQFATATSNARAKRRRVPHKQNYQE